MIIAIKSRSSAVIYSFQDFEQEINQSRQKFYFVSIHDKKQTRLFSLGVLYSLDPPNAYLWGGPDPPGNRRAWSQRGRPAWLNKFVASSFSSQLHQILKAEVVQNMSWFHRI